MANNAAFSAYVTSVTQDLFIPKVVDQVLNGNVLTMKLLNNIKTWNGGETIVLPVNLTAYTNLGSYSGFDAFPTAQQNTRQKANWYASQLYVTLSVAGIQLAANQGQSQVVSILRWEMEQRARDLKDMMGDQIYGDGTGNSNKDILGLQAAVDDATTVSTYGALSRSTYTNWKATRNAQSGSLSLANLAADVDAAQHGSDGPDLMITTPAVWTIYEALLTPTVSHNFNPMEFRLTPEGSRPLTNLGANQGFRALSFRGIPVVADEKCTSGNIYTLNTNYLDFYYIPQTGIAGKQAQSGGFYWTGWKPPVNQDAMTGQILWYGQLITTSPRMHVRRTGVTS